MSNQKQPTRNMQTASRHTASGRISRPPTRFSEQTFYAPPMANNKYTKGRKIVPGLQIQNEWFVDADHEDFKRYEDEDRLSDFIVSDAEDEESVSEYENGIRIQYQFI